MFFLMHLSKQAALPEQMALTEITQVGTTLGGPVGKNPLYKSTLANSDELLQWMIDEGQTSTESTSY